MTDRIVARGGYRWTCPFCNKSQLNTAVDSSGRENAIAALRTHIVATDGDGHGPRNAFPDGFDQSVLADNVVRIEGRRTNG